MYWVAKIYPDYQAILEQFFFSQIAFILPTTKSPPLIPHLNKSALV